MKCTPIQLYNFGSDWKRIFSRLPHLLAPWQLDYEKERADALARCQLLERQDKAFCELNEFDWPGNATSVKELYDEYRRASQVNMLLIFDAETFHPSQLSNVGNEPTAMVVWVDAYGNVIRWARGAASDVGDLTGLAANGAQFETEIWMNGHFCEDYELGSDEEIAYLGLEDLPGGVCDLNGEKLYRLSNYV